MRQSAPRTAQSATRTHGSARNKVAATLSALAVAGGMTAALLGAFGGATSSAASAPAHHSASAVRPNGTQMG